MDGNSASLKRLSRQQNDGFRFVVVLGLVKILNIRRCSWSCQKKKLENGMQECSSHIVPGASSDIKCEPINMSGL
jgi:hypothetical protein